MREIDDDDEGLASHGCSTLVQGPEGRVGITPKVLKEWNKLDAQRRGRLKRTMTEWCAGRRLHREVYKSGGSYGKSPGGRTIAVFKAWQVRLYGFEEHMDGVRTFIIIDADLAKKQDEADADTISRLKARADAFGKGK
jgi:hypothetical protein